MKAFLSGVIEGFYGRSWPAEVRLRYATYLQQLGLNSYIYCPKNDPCLRKHWHRDWPSDQWRDLQQQSATYRSKGLSWGLGLSPFELYRNYGPEQRRLLQHKVERIAELQPAVLAILFDDMPGALDSLAQRQAEIITDVARWLPGVRLLACPTYYSFDPVLEKYFGAMPAAYWEQLGAALPPEVAVFWTGNSVCSETITVADIHEIAARLRCPLVLWDNYPVNDGAVRSRRLYCQPLAQRDPELKSLLAGHYCNPMNQALLSLPALTGLASLYCDAGVDEAWLRAALGAGTWSALEQDREAFLQLGLDGLGAERTAQLAQRYQQLPGEAAAEVAGWLRGEYTFDPTCLTD